MKLFKASQLLMGSAFELAVACADELVAQQALEAGIAEISRIEDLLSEFKPDSTTSLLNAQAGIRPVKVEPEFFDLLERCGHISKLTKGCFDVTIGRLKNLYAFKNKQFEMPLQAQIDEARKAVGHEKILLNRRDSSVAFAHPALRISFAAIGKGYAASQVKKIWQQAGIRSGYVNASGDLTAFGSKPDGQPWEIGIANPDDRDKPLLFVPLHDASAATSGDYEQFFLWNNTRYSHNLDPRTGVPLTGLKSVTVFSPNAELSDALATAVYVMGAEAGVDFINQLPQTHCIMIDDRNCIHFSEKLKYEKI